MLFFLIYQVHKFNDTSFNLYVHSEAKYETLFKILHNPQLMDWNKPMFVGGKIIH